MRGGICIKALLVALNAKYIHTNPAVRSIAAYCAARLDNAPAYAEYTVNQRHGDVLQALYQAGADCYLFSCYIWNIEYIARLTDDLSQLLPHARIALGGPEADWQAQALLCTLPQVDMVVMGEGEYSVCRLLQALVQGTPVQDCPGIAMRSGNEAVITDLPPLLDLSELPFAYTDLHKLEGRIPYYESMRGCPFSCSYCLSAGLNSVRLRPLEMVFADLQVFLCAGIPQVKLVDRTFNCNPARAVAIWRFLIEHDNGVTNFHFELAGDLLDEQSLAVLQTARPGLFQFEIGVQSTHDPTLHAIHRVQNTGVLRQRVQSLQRSDNIHLHLDLIAGLPHEDFLCFSHSFDEVYALAPQQLQLGFLKLLGGSPLREQAEEYAILYRQTAPYEVLCTQWLAYEELCSLHGVAEMVDSFYNSGRFRNLLNAVVPLFDSPFAFYHRLSQFYVCRQQGRPLSKLGYFDLLGDFLLAQGIAITDELQWLCLYDLLLHEKPRGRPRWVKVSLYEPNRTRLASARREFRPDVHLEVFPFSSPGRPQEACIIVFDYARRDYTGRAQTQVLDLQAHNEYM